MDSLWFDIYLPLIWALLIGVAVFLYVLLDGFDLGLGILYPFTKEEGERDQMMNSVAPFWDGNETWLILGGGGLWVAFPKAYAVIMPAVYLPVIVMLLALVFRGVAFEFRFVSKPNHRWWDIAFIGGSTVAAFCQGVVLGAVVYGLPVENDQFAGGPFDWLHPFSIMCGFGVVVGYALLGSGWLMMRTEGPLREKAQRWAMPLLVALVAFIAAVSVWTPLVISEIANRWFSLPEFLYLAPVPLLTLFFAWLARRGIARGKGAMTFVPSVCLFLLCFVGLAVSNFPYLVPRHITVWQAAAAPESQLFVLLGAIPLVPIILIYTGFIYWTFRGTLKPGEGYH
ncbi:cytochrome d ubiquinol oxidase subunit II [Acuticoccus mangrovi]|uniref:Cytochrome d ubiquinol oxidase subunit II n=1 Tax=Acuticoccus mangrovi TaxID=2796142 RepID=A0A934MFI2_9HYPH|nr:cytochrome d ubiquinol oxidase subunit II [Acuticoccus mangrovi]MBJ3775498.1 cytochrome d ubiquinol oxidase subunit II [Acuticoccus mangrovi]